MTSIPQSKLGSEGPSQLVVPDVLGEPTLIIEGQRLDVVEYGEGESRHIYHVRQFLTAFSIPAYFPSARP
jgi:hypothetical protein